MDEEKKSEDLENKNSEETEQEKKQEETLEKVEEGKKEEKQEEQLVDKEEEKTEYVPEQLDDEDFDKEKEKIKEEKKAKKLAKKQEKEETKNKVSEDEEPKKKKNKKILTIVLIILVIAIIVGGIAGYFIINLNNPENAVNDFIIYFNNEEWDNVANLVDMKGFLTLSLIDTEISEAEDNDEDAGVSYMDYDSRYETVYEDLKTAGYYDELMEIIEYGEENNSEILEAMFEGYTMTIETIKSTEKIENTDSLYKITLLCTLTYDSEDSTDTYEVYVSKTDGEYKLVGGDLPYLIYTAYVYYQYYMSYSG